MRILHFDGEDGKWDVVIILKKITHIMAVKVLEISIIILHSILNNKISSFFNTQHVNLISPALHIPNQLIYPKYIPFFIIIYSKI